MTPTKQKDHKTSQNVTDNKLKPNQVKAIELLVSGKSDRKVAETIEVSRETVTRWRTNPYFSSELNKQRNALFSTAMRRLWGLTQKAIDNLEALIEDGDRSASLDLLKMIGFRGLKEHAAFTPRPLEENPALLVEAMVREKVEAEMREENIGEDPYMNDMLMMPEFVAQRVKERYSEIVESINSE